MEIARAHRVSHSSGARFFERWCDLESHPQWAPSMEYFILDGPFGVGATGRSRPVGGDEAPFTVTQIGPGWVYADATDLGDAILTVHHAAIELDDVTHVTLTALLEGREATALATQLSSALQEALERDLASLATMLEAEPFTG